MPPKKTDKPEDKKSGKRGHYRQKECPFCHAFVGNLPNHIKGKHPTEAEKIPPQEITKGQLLGVEPKPPKPKSPGDTIYYCTNCKAELRKGETPCWNCGEDLIWEGIE